MLLPVASHYPFPRPTNRQPPTAIPTTPQCTAHRAHALANSGHCTSDCGRGASLPTCMHAGCSKVGSRQQARGSRQTGRDERRCAVRTATMEWFPLPLRVRLGLRLRLGSRAAQPRLDLDSARFGWWGMGRWEDDVEKVAWGLCYAMLCCDVVWCGVHRGAEIEWTRKRGRS